MRESFKKVFYYFRIVTIILFMILIITLLNNILKCGFEGISLLIFFVILIIIYFYTILSKKKNFKESISYNLINIGLFAYTLFIWSKIYLDSKINLTSIYEVNIAYFKNNYLILSTIILGIIFQTIILNSEK